MASAWKITPVQENLNFSEIMSEEYAHRLQAEEIKKNEKRLSSGEESQENLASYAHITTQAIEKPSNNAIEQLDYSAWLADSNLSESNGCESDAMIAQMLQLELNEQYNKEMDQLNKVRNGQSKVTVVLDNLNFSYSENKNSKKADKDSGDDDDDNEALNEKEELDGMFSRIPRKMTKVKKNKMSDRKGNLATAELGVDNRTRLILYKLVNNKILEQINGVVSTGKEATILHANSDPEYTVSERNNYHLPAELPKECAIKIFKTTLNEFKQRDRYIKDDYRFRDRYKNQERDDIINLWAEKEMHNLMRMKNAGINCPDLVLLRKHILVMSFIGNDRIAAPKLKDAELSDAELASVYEEMVAIMYKLYNEAKLVHADLSEYNILWHDKKCWIIDVAQSVEPEHPGSFEFLMRDCENVINFFGRRGLTDIYTKEQLFEHITSLNAETHNVAMLERIHTRGYSEKYNEQRRNDYPFELAWQKAQDELKKPAEQTAWNAKCNFEAGQETNNSLTTPGSTPQK